MFSKAFKRPKLKSLFAEWSLGEDGLELKSPIPCSSVFPSKKFVGFSDIIGVVPNKYISGPYFLIQVNESDFKKRSTNVVEVDLNKIKSKLRQESKKEEEYQFPYEQKVEKKRREIVFINPNQHKRFVSEIGEKYSEKLKILDPSSDVWREILLPTFEAKLKPDFLLLEDEFGIFEKEVVTLQKENEELIKNYNISQHAGLLTWDYHWGVKDILMAYSAFFDEEKFSEKYWKVMEVSTRKVPPLFDPAKPRKNSFNSLVNTILRKN